MSVFSYSYSTFKNESQWNSMQLKYKSDDTIKFGTGQIKFRLIIIRSDVTVVIVKFFRLFLVDNTQHDI